MVIIRQGGSSDRQNALVDVVVGVVFVVVLFIDLLIY
jgi:hypothetical protein